jgi:peptide/nickel transport system substrate-binding protein
MQETDSLNAMNTKIFTLILMNSFLILNLACTPKSDKPKDTIVVAISSIPTTLDPRFALDSEGMKIGALIFQSLVKIGPDMNVIGDAAESWSLDIIQKNSKNMYDLNFLLKQNLYFHDGQKVNCSDIIFSINEYQNEDSPFKSAFSNIVDKKCKDQSLTLTFDTYSEKVLNSDLPVIKILPEAEVLKHKAAFKSNLMGSGPYKIAKLYETEINLNRNSNYATPPQIPNLQFKVIKDDFTRFLKMYKGDLDLAVSSLPKNKIKSLEKVKHLSIIKKPGLSMAYLLLNLKNPELAKLENRKLIFEGIDRNEIIKYKLEGLAQPATSLLTPANPYFWPEFLNFKSAEPNLVALREKVLATELSQKVLNLKTSNTREAVENAKLIAAQLRKIGFRINHESYEWGTYYKDVNQGEFDLATMTWVGAYDPDIYRIALASQEIPPDGRNRGYYSNKKFDQLMALGMNELDPILRKQIYFEAQKIIYEDLAIIPLWYEDTITVIDKRIHNYTPSLNGDYSGLLKASLSSEQVLSE